MANAEHLDYERRVQSLRKPNATPRTVGEQPSRPSGLDAMLAIQRLAGNQAATSILRDLDVTPRPATPKPSPLSNSWAVQPTSAVGKAGLPAARQIADQLAPPKPLKVQRSFKDLVKKVKKKIKKVFTSKSKKKTPPGKKRPVYGPEYSRAVKSNGTQSSLKPTPSPIVETPTESSTETTEQKDSTDGTGGGVTYGGTGGVTYSSTEISDDTDEGLKDGGLNYGGLTYGGLTYGGTGGVTYSSTEIPDDNDSSPNYGDTNYSSTELSDDTDEGLKDGGTAVNYGNKKVKYTDANAEEDDDLDDDDDDDLSDDEEEKEPEPELSQPGKKHWRTLKKNKKYDQEDLSSIGQLQEIMESAKKSKEKQQQDGRTVTIGEVMMEEYGWSPSDVSQYLDEKDELKAPKVKYLAEPTERASYELRGSGTLFQGEDKKPFTTKGMFSKHSGKDWGIYVLDPDGKVYAGQHRVGLFHHSSLLAGQDVAGAGELKVSEDGKLEHITNKTGHYHGDEDYLWQTVDEFKDRGINLSAFKVSTYDMKIEGRLAEWFYFSHKPKSAPISSTFPPMNEPDDDDDDDDLIDDEDEQDGVIDRGYSDEQKYGGDKDKSYTTGGKTYTGGGKTYTTGGDTYTTGGNNYSDDGKTYTTSGTTGVTYGSDKDEEDDDDDDDKIVDRGYTSNNYQSNYTT